MLDWKKKKIGGDKIDSKKKQRHIVTWTPQEDDELREQVSVHGTENWPMIASKFKDKTARQCRRRWYTYLNSDFKKGGWSLEEDMLLCEAQKILGNRWIEIAKVVSGRTDNAVKNRFTTLCKKRAKSESLAKVNNASCVNPNGKRIILCGTSNSCQTTGSNAVNKKLRRAHIRDASVQDDQLPRTPLAVLAPNFHPKVEEKACNGDAQDAKAGETFMNKNDPRAAALMQQPEILSSLAIRVNGDSSEQCLEDAWKDLLDRNNDGDIIDFQLQNLKDTVANFTSSKEGSQTSWRDSPATPEYSTRSTTLFSTSPDKTCEPEAEGTSIDNRLHRNHTGDISRADECDEIFPTSVIEPEDTLQSCDEQINTEVVVSVTRSKEFSSPLQVTPVFRSLAAGIPSPKFSESERNFLMRTLRIESLSPSPSTNSVHPPSCKRVLLQSL